MQPQESHRWGGRRVSFSVRLLWASAFCSSCKITKMQEINQVFEVRETKRVGSVGCCIYCGATNELTDEHVIPLALAGNIIVPDASCRACAAITSDFERR